MSKLNGWTSQIFDSKQAKNEGIVRRSIESVRKFSSEAELLDAVKERGYHLIRTEKQYIILCNTGIIKLLI